MSPSKKIKTLRGNQGNSYTPASIGAATAIRQQPLYAGGNFSSPRQLLLDSLGERYPLRRGVSLGSCCWIPLASRDPCARCAWRENAWLQELARGASGGVSTRQALLATPGESYPPAGGVALTKGWGTLDAHVGPCFQQGPTGLNVSSMSCDLIQVASQSIISNKLNNSITAVRLNALSGPAALAGPHWAQWVWVSNRLTYNADCAGPSLRPQGPARLRPTRNDVFIDGGGPARLALIKLRWLWLWL